MIRIDSRSLSQLPLESQREPPRLVLSPLSLRAPRRGVQMGADSPTVATPSAASAMLADAPTLTTHWHNRHHLQPKIPGRCQTPWDARKFWRFPSTRSVTRYGSRLCCCHCCCTRADSECGSAAVAAAAGAVSVNRGTGRRQQRAGTRTTSHHHPLTPQCVDTTGETARTGFTHLRAQ